MGAPLALAEVCKGFRAGSRAITALNGVDFTVSEGRITGLVGPDGAGKTTLMRLAAGLMVPERGTVTVLGRDAAREALAVQAEVGYMPQRFGLYEDLTVMENLELYADLQGVPRAERAAHYGELMHMTGLAPFTSRLAGRLSGGMKQKLGLACALLRSPRLLLLDEPTVGVDPLSRRELWRIVDALVSGAGTTVLMSTAYLDEAERCAEVVLLHEGEVLGQGPPQAFSEPLRGRTFRLHLPGRARGLQARAAALDGVVDAVAVGGELRLVIAAQADIDAVAAALGTREIETVAPRFEDGFVARLRERRRPAKGGDGFILRGGISDSGSGPVISVRELTRRFGDFTAVRALTFEVRRGEVFGLLGANGAGKSTTFRMLCGLLPASEGELQVAGYDLRRAPADARARIGYMSQKFSLYQNLSVRQNLEFFASGYGLTGERRRTRVGWALEHFDLTALADTDSIDLSLGHKQRLAMACSLMHQPEILFLDEPTSGVDPLARREFWHRINALAEAGVTVLVTTHFLEEAEYCDRIAIMSAGEILRLGTPAAIKREMESDSLEGAFIRLIESREAER